MLRGFLLLGASLAMSSAVAESGDKFDVVAVYSSVSPAYTRSALPAGGFKPETFTFGEGGELGAPIRDVTIDKLHFVDVARLIAPSLASQSFVPANDPKQTDLLIMVYWGTTGGTNSMSEYQIAEDLIPPPPPPKLSYSPNAKASNGSGDPGMSGNGLKAAEIQTSQIAADNAFDGAMAVESFANEKREKQDLESAKILGYLPELASLSDRYPTALGLHREEIVDELEEDRYFVVLMAYDFQTIWKHKQRKLLWETRLSIRARGHDFSKDVAAMAQNASKYFGQDSHGLVRNAYDADVTIGAMKVLGYDRAGSK